MTISAANVRSQPARRVQGAPAWHGEFRLDRDLPWRKVLNKHELPICYTDPVYAINAALLVGTQEMEKE